MDHFALTAKKMIELIPKQTRHMEGVFASLPNQTWPEDFPKYMEKLQEEEPSQKWCKTHCMSLAIPQARQNAYFGHRVMKAWDDCKRIINNVLNPIWNRVPQGPLPSGVQPADVLYWVRRESWTAEAIERSKVSARQKHSRAIKDNPQAPKFNVHEHMEAIEAVAKDKPFKDTWFPKMWLVFVHLGLPSSDPASQFCSGLASTSPKARLEEVCASNKTNRRLARELDTPSSTEVVSEPAKKRSRSSNDHQLTVCIAESEGAVIQRKINGLVLYIDKMKEMGGSPSRIRDAEEALLNLLERSYLDV
jgi:hypothetical protein